MYSAVVRYRPTFKCLVLLDPEHCHRATLLQALDNLRVGKVLQRFPINCQDLISKSQEVCCNHVCKRDLKNHYAFCMAVIYASMQHKFGCRCQVNLPAAPPGLIQETTTGMPCSFPPFILNSNPSFFRCRRTVLVPLALFMFYLLASSSPLSVVGTI